MKKIKSIAFVWEQLGIGGVDSYLSYLINSSNFKNLEITIFTNKSNGALTRFNTISENKNIKIVKYSSLLVFENNKFYTKFILYFLKPFLFFFTIINFTFLLKNKNFDVILGQCGGYGGFRTEVAALIASKIVKIPVRSIVIHHCSQYPPLFLGFVIKFIDLILSRCLNSVICVSNATRETLFYKSYLLQRETELHDCVIHNGVPFFNINKSNSKFNFSNFLNSDQEKIIKIGIIANINLYKGHFDLVSAVHIMNEELKKKCKFFIIGESNEGTKTSLVNLIKNLQLDDNFIFTGYINENSQTIISNLDLLVSLTRSFEGFGLSLAEALSIGTPVLATNVGAVKEYLTEEMTDLLQPSDIISIRNKLENFIENKEEWKKKAIINKEIFLKKNNSELMSLKYFNHLTQQFNLV